MRAALVATLSRPEWWAMALAAFLVRGGFILVVLPIIAVPTAAGVVTTLSPVVEGIWLGTPSLEGALVGSVVLLLLFVGLAAAAMAGSWLDLALVREATEDEDVDRGWRPVHASIAQALSIRLAAHVPTLLALAYGFLRVIDVAYTEFLSPSEAGVSIVDRVLVRVPEVVLLVVVAWLLGETIGPLAARRAAAGTRSTRALLAAGRQVLSPRGLGTLALTSVVIAGVLLPFTLAAGWAWEHLRGYLLDDAIGVQFGALQLGAALVLLVASWILGLAVLGAVLAWRAAAWTSEVTTD
jgi:hypothetical protein